LFVPMFIAEFILRLWQISALFFAVPVMIIANAKAIRKRIPSGKTILLAFTVTITTAVFDILDSLIMNTGYGFTKYSFFLFIMTLMLILARKFVELHNRTEELNLNLEHKVEERTKELKNTLQTVNDLKVQQDGDYFLTSLITEPLGLNMNKSIIIKTDMYISQKKKFEFRKRRGELGGDICVTGNLRFGTMENRYVMFFNGDAMGKSMQGAGGAIVAGTVVNNIMSKSARNNRVLTEVTPEKWLKATFNELDNAFRTFNGSMLVSGVMGLISEQTGELLYFNAEHPYLVLYRDGIADFIDKEIYLRKLGTELIEKFTIIRFQLLPGDVLFAGSDGKDDIKMGEHKDMNEDERLFLRQVEKSRGELEILSRMIHNSGEIADDLSLLKISYQ
ncbi:MAG TPA: SpoIIE family protein phosphatase, partial [Leptospiraceae bacterium]|nr:SpoIIE family protein phosphatase [Leptospiraceae bacterium]